MLTATRAYFAAERLTDTLWAELIPLLIAHYHEVAHFKDIALAPDRAGYQRIWDAGMLRIYTARKDARLIGYMVGFITPSLHYCPKVFFNQDILFVAKQWRGSRIGVDLIGFAHQRMRDEDGVDVCFQHTKSKPELNIGPMLCRLLGYEEVDIIYAKRLDLE